MNWIRLDEIKCKIQEFICAKIGHKGKAVDDYWGLEFRCERCGVSVTTSSKNIEQFKKEIRFYKRDPVF